MNINPDVFKFEVCHHENIKWSESMVFYAEELTYFQKLLKEVFEKNSNPAIKEQVVHFQQKAQTLSDQLYHLALGIINQEKVFAEYAQGDKFLFSEQIELIHQRQQVAFDQSEREFLRIKKELYDFLKKAL
ncbi:MAG: hypothetical protein QE277_07985 [Flectobacillus sp.]|jgi:hypothetical protein|nr:hypothetical protein [Flectobacillus sp.]